MLQWQFVSTFCICIILAASFCVSAHTYEFSGTWVQTLPAYAIASVANLINSTTCGKELLNFRGAVDRRIPWSLEMLDSSGRFKPGFLYGNIYWLGSRIQCLDTMNAAPVQISEQKVSNSTLHRVSQKEFPPFEINYFVAHFRHNSTLKYNINIFNEDVITLGLCLPASCAINDLTLILERIFHDKVVLIDHLYSVDFQLIQIKDLKDNNEWMSSGAFLFVCTVLAFSLFMMTTGTIYDIFVHQEYIKGNTTTTHRTNVDHVSKNIKTEVNFSSHRESRIGRILMCFSVYTNTRIIFSELDADEIPASHGLKFLGMCCLIILHTVYFTLDSVDNKIWIWRQFNSFNSINIGILIIAVTISVDIFFFLSGFFIIHSYLKKKMNKGQIESTNCKEKLIDLFVQIVKRFIRLTPAYMMALSILQLSSIWLDKTSQFYMYERSHELCAKYWWRNLLYINNFFGFDAMCMIWSWYIASDMQFYIIAMILLTLSTTYFYAIVMTVSALLIGSTIFNGYNSYIYGVVPPLIFNEHWRESLDVFYFPSWNRINPFIIGIVTRYMLMKAKNYFISKSKTIILLWCLVVAHNLVVTFVLLGSDVSILSIAIYFAVYRILWAIPIALIIIRNFIKFKDIINQFLSFKYWVPFSRLAYCVYLLHPIIIRTMSLQRDTSVRFEYLSMFVTSMGYIVISYVCSYVFFLMMEMPYISLMEMFIQYRNINKYKMLDKKVS